MEDKSDGSPDDKSTSDLESVLKQLASYKHVGDTQDISPEVQALLRQAEESQAREENRREAWLLRARRPRERRRRKGSDSSLAGRTHAGGSLDNMAAADGKTAAKHKGVAGHTGRGGSCFNLSRGSFEPGRRRQRQQHGGSLEDLSAIDEAAGGGARGSAAEAAKSGGSLQNLSQEAAAGGGSGGSGGSGGGGGGSGGELRPPAARQDVVIQIDDSGDEDARSAARALAAPCGDDQPERGTGLRELVRPAGPVRPSLEEGGAALLAAAAAAADVRDRRPAGTAASELRARQQRRTAFVTAAGQPGAAEETPDQTRAEPPTSARKTQVLDGGGSAGSRQDSIRPKRKAIKQEPAAVQTDSVQNYQGHRDVEDLVGFIESSTAKPPAGEKAGRKAERAGRRGVKGRRSAEERRAARRPAARRSPAGRSASLEARPPADRGRLFDGEAAPPATAPAVPALWECDGKTYVSAPPAATSDGFVQDFYSVATDSPVPEETEFLVVTRKQRRRRRVAAAVGPCRRLAQRAPL